MINLNKNFFVLSKFGIISIPESTKSIAERCQKLNLWHDDIDVHTCITATTEYLKKNYLKKPFVIIENDTKADFKSFDLVNLFLNQKICRSAISSSISLGSRKSGLNRYWLLSIQFNIPEHKPCLSSFDR